MSPNQISNHNFHNNIINPNNSNSKLFPSASSDEWHRSDRMLGNRRRRTRAPVPRSSMTGGIGVGCHQWLQCFLLPLILATILLVASTTAEISEDELATILEVNAEEQPIQLRLLRTESNNDMDEADTRSANMERHQRHRQAFSSEAEPMWQYLQFLAAANQQPKPESNSKAAPLIKAPKKRQPVRRCGTLLIKHIQTVCNGCLRSATDADPIMMSKRGGGSEMLEARNRWKREAGFSKITDICCTQRACADQELKPFCC